MYTMNLNPTGFPVSEALGCHGKLRFRAESFEIQSKRGLHSFEFCMISISIASTMGGQRKSNLITPVVYVLNFSEETQLFGLSFGSGSTVAKFSG